MPDYDIPSLLEYRGPSRRTEGVGPDWITILDYRNTDENERVAGLLLSSQGVPFRIDRPGPGWSQGKVRLHIIVPRERLDDAASLLAAAAAQTALEPVEGDEDW